MSHCCGCDVDHASMTSSTLYMTSLWAFMTSLYGLMTSLLVKLVNQGTVRWVCDRIDIVHVSLSWLWRGSRFYDVINLTYDVTVRIYDVITLIYDVIISKTSQPMDCEVSMRRDWHCKCFIVVAVTWITLLWRHQPYLWRHCMLIWGHYTDLWRHY